jgi:Leucine-rich repeat (LRR) protein
MFSHGPLPECISALRNLEALFIANCNVTGPLPHWLCNLKELRQLDLQRNGLTGHIPKSISSLTNLLYLNVKDNNGLTGPLPVDELSKMTRLNRLSLVHCSFENVQESSTVLQDRLPRCRIWV